MFIVLGGLTFDKNVLVADLRNSSIGIELKTIKAGHRGNPPFLLSRRHLKMCVIEIGDIGYRKISNNVTNIQFSRGK